MCSARFSLRTGWKVPAPTCSVTLALPMPRLETFEAAESEGPDIDLDREVIEGEARTVSADEARTLRGGGKVWKFEGRAMVEGELACEATFMAMFDVPKAEAKAPE